MIQNVYTGCRNNMLRVGKWLGIVGVVLASFLMVVVSVVKARAEGEEGIEVKDEVTTEERDALDNRIILVEEVNYYLPYPGVLPDHPFYFVKMMRDKIREWTLFDGARKAEYWSLLADKRIAAGKVLIEGNKQALGIQTYRKAVGYLQKAVVEIEKLEGKGREMGGLTNKLEQAILKYNEILERSASENEDLRGQTEEIKREIDMARERVFKLLDRV